MSRRAALAALAAVMLGGCGGSSLSNDQLRSQATRLCNLAESQTDRAATPSSPTEMTGFLEKGIAVMKPELVQLRALHPTQDLTPVYATATAALAQQLAALQRAEATIQRGDNPVTATKALGQKLAPLRMEADGAWQALQLPACLSR